MKTSIKSIQPCVMAFAASAGVLLALSPATLNAQNNTATGTGALTHLTTGASNTADGVNALEEDTSGSTNTATGMNALHFNKSGGGNTANGLGALANNINAANNTAVGYYALQQTMPEAIRPWVPGPFSPTQPDTTTRRLG